MDEAEGLKAVRERMLPGIMSLEGFLGTDTRALERILEEDAAAVHRLGLTHERIADRLRHFTVLALSGYGTPRAEEDFEVVIQEARGGVVCPFGEPERYRKGEVRLRNLETGAELAWTPLQVHLIGAHGFYEGRGSRYRMEPAAAKEVLGL